LLRSPTSASDLATAILDIVRQLASSDGCRIAGIYHLAGQGERRMIEAATETPRFQLREPLNPATQTKEPLAANSGARAVGYPSE
jgi:dTDP-4-dehydrorhamnose reductase